MKYKVSSSSLALSVVYFLDSIKKFPMDCVQSSQTPTMMASKVKIKDTLRTPGKFLF